MKDILQQIQQLKEDFMNLKEVDDVGLGQPASDTPPSTNKIKRNVKTKNGKAELVSVEDELFPYDGSKREQYRQKIIDTVNAMIQGTATLDDLLQVVRSQKNTKPVKEGFEGAIEVLEELILERNKENKTKKENWELKTNKITKKYKKGIQDYAKEQGDEAKFHQVAADDYDHIYSQQPAMAPNGTPNSVAAYFNDKYREMLRNKGRNEQNIADATEPLTNRLKNRKHAFHDMVRGYSDGSESLKEALKILEGLFVNDGRGDFFWNDIAGRSDTPISAASNVLKNKLNKVYKGTQKRAINCSVENPMSKAISILEEVINEVSDKWVDGKRENYKIKRDKAIIRHAQTMTDENPEGDTELLKDRQSKIDRLNKFDEKNKRYKELKREGKIKPCKDSKEYSNG